MYDLRSHHLELHQTGPTEMLAVNPRSTSHPTDELLIGIGRHDYGGGKSIIVSRTQAQELHDWLAGWLAGGWDGVKPVEGPTSAAVIEHYKAAAMRAQHGFDERRAEAMRLLDAALALIPADVRAHHPDLDVIAKQQTEAWQRLQADADRGEETRLRYLTGLQQIEDALASRAEKVQAGDVVTPAEEALAAVRKTLQQLVDRANFPAVKPTADPVPIYDPEQLELFAA